MEDCLEISLRNICCTCLSKDRKLYQLCRIANGINNLYLLLSLDIEAYREGFYKDTVNLFICWECRAVFSKLSSFREQACVAQKMLSYIDNGRVSIDSQQSLSKLSTQKVIDIQTNFKLSLDNFIDCGDVQIIKQEVDPDDIPLSEIKLETNFDNTISDNDIVSNSNVTDIVDSYLDDDNTIIDKLDDRTDDIDDLDIKDDLLIEKVTCDNKDLKSEMKSVKLNKLFGNGNVNELDWIKKGVDTKGREGDESYEGKVYFKTYLMSESEMLECREKRRLAADFVDAPWQCFTCLDVFESRINYEMHICLMHMEKPNHVQCPICEAYITSEKLEEHMESHFYRHMCQLCEYVAYSDFDIFRHLRCCHKVMGVRVASNKGSRAQQVKSAVSKPRKNKPMTDARNHRAFKCRECDKYFKNTNLRYKHVQRWHREGYECDICGKKFSFKDYLTKHIRLHEASMPREECQICHKMVRADLFKKHSQIHSERETVSCVECDKKFVSRTSYERHLKYSQAHASPDLLKFKCSKCDKGYRNKAALRDHFNYIHLGKTQHKCPICGKAIATRHCVLRHIKRVHQDIKDGLKNKICKQCGKAFRDKKGLREHEFIHTGERPLSCEICGCTFRQNASLYTHKKRIHKIFPKKKSIEVLKQTR